MDIHKPKPVHGWREFLSEIGVIVIGVLIALLAEQVVESLHWRERVNQAKESFRAELSADAFPVRAEAVLEPCETAMLDRLQQALLAPGEAWRPPFLIKSAGQDLAFSAPIGTFSIQSWANARADGAASHLSHADQGAFGVAFEALDRLQTLNDDQRAAIAELNSLASPRALDPQSRTGYLRLIARIRETTHLSAWYGGTVLQALKVVSVTPEDEKNDPVLAGYRKTCDAFRRGETQLTMD